MLRNAMVMAARGACEAILIEVHGDAPNDLREACVGFVIGVWHEMRPVLRFGTAVMAALLLIESRARRFVPFRRVRPEHRNHQLQAWSRSRLFPKRAFAQLIRVLTVLAMEDDNLVLAAEGHDVTQYRKMFALYNGGPAYEP